MDCFDYYFKKIYNEAGHLGLERIRGLLGDFLVKYQKFDVGSTNQKGASSW